MKLRAFRKFTIFFIILLSGCSLDRAGLKDSSKIKKTVLGASVLENPIISYSMGDGDDVLLLMASIHGNERAGTPLCFRFMTFLQNHPEMLDGKTVVFLPVTNPDGYTSQTRYNANGVDLNRNFPTENRINNDMFGNYPLSEPEARAAAELIDTSMPDRIVSFHEPYNCIDFDGPAENFANYLSDFCDLEIKKIGLRPGSLGSYAGEKLGIPIVTIEFSGEAASLSEEEMWLKYRNLLIAAVEYSEEVHVHLPYSGITSQKITLNMDFDEVFMYPSLF